MRYESVTLVYNLSRKVEKGLRKYLRPSRQKYKSPISLGSDHESVTLN